jgi:hypothetical protein
MLLFYPIFYGFHFFENSKVGKFVTFFLPVFLAALCFEKADWFVFELGIIDKCHEKKQF